MGRRGAEGIYKLPRGTVESDRQARIKNRSRPKSFASTAPQYFVPSFAVRRRVLITPEVKDFVKELKEDLPRNYRVIDPRSLAMTIIEQRRLVNRFRLADVHPEPEMVERVVGITARNLKHSLHGVPRRLEVPTGRVDSFGDEGKKDKVGIIPKGWKGYSAHYAERDMEKKILPMPIIIRETNVCLGGIITAFGSDEELERGINMDCFSRTPHITVAQKMKGGPISHGEMQSMAAVVDEIMPDTLELFDPVLHMRLYPGQVVPIDVSARSPRMSRNGPLL